jgi:hypothetical protein
MIRIVTLVFAVLAVGCTPAADAQKGVVHDAEYYILEAQTGLQGLRHRIAQESARLHPPQRRSEEALLPGLVATLDVVHP